MIIIKFWSIINCFTKDIEFPRRLLFISKTLIIEAFLLHFLELKCLRGRIIP